MRPAVFAVLFLAGCGGGDAPVRVTDATVRLSPLPGRPAAGFFVADGGGAQARLLSVTSPRASRVEFHTSERTGGTMSMRPLRPEELVFSGEPLAFVGGGKHLMIYGVAPQVKPGGRLPLTFRFDRGEPVTVMAEVTAAGGGNGAAH